jgi:hypothetical protein
MDDYKYFDFYDYDAVQKVLNDRTQQLLAIVRSYVTAQANEDEAGRKRAVQRKIKHDRETEEFRKKARKYHPYI